MEVLHATLTTTHSRNLAELHMNELYRGLELTAAERRALGKKPYKVRTPVSARQSPKGTSRQKALTRTEGLPVSPLYEDIMAEARKEFYLSSRGIAPKSRMPAAALLPSTSPGPTISTVPTTAAPTGTTTPAKGSIVSLPTSPTTTTTTTTATTTATTTTTTTSITGLASAIAAAPGLRVVGMLQAENRELQIDAELARLSLEVKDQYAIVDLDSGRVSRKDGNYNDLLAGRRDIGDTALINYEAARLAAAGELPKGKNVDDIITEAKDLISRGQQIWTGGGRGGGTNQLQHYGVRSRTAILTDLKKELDQKGAVPVGSNQVLLGKKVSDTAKLQPWMKQIAETRYDNKVEEEEEKRRASTAAAVIGGMAFSGVTKEVLSGNAAAMVKFNPGTSTAVLEDAKRDPEKLLTADVLWTYSLMKVDKKLSREDQVVSAKSNSGFSAANVFANSPGAKKYRSRVGLLDIEKTREQALAELTHAGFLFLADGRQIYIGKAATGALASAQLLALPGKTYKL